MKLHVEFTDRSIELKMGCLKDFHLDLWIVNAMKVAWKVWVCLGWNETNATRIGHQCWSTFSNDTEKDLVINEILRFNHVMAQQRHVTSDTFENGWTSILHIAYTIREKHFYLGKTPEVDQFRREVARYITFIISKGCDITNPTIPTFFISSTDEKFADTPVCYPWEVIVTSKVKSSIFNVMVSEVEQPHLYITDFVCSFHN